MRVDLFSIGNFTIHSYGLLIAVGVILAVIMAMKRAGKKDLNSEVVLNMAIICVVFGFLGAKLLYVLENFRAFLEDPLSVIGSSGFVVYGGIFIGVAAIILYCRIKKYSFFRYFDLLMPSVALGQAFGRLGCFCAGCCYGRETDLAWGVVFPEGSFAPAGVPLIPTQLISSAGDFAIMIILLFVQQKGEKSGRCGSALSAFIWDRPFSGGIPAADEQGGIGIFTTAQLMSFVFIAASVILFIRNRKGRHAENYQEEYYSIWL